MPLDVQMFPPEVIGFSSLEVAEMAKEIHVDWDEDGEILRYPVNSPQMAVLIRQKLIQIFSERKDAIDKAVTEGKTDNATNLIHAAKQSMLRRTEGYSQYVTYDGYKVLDDSRIGLMNDLVDDLATIMTAVLSGGPMTSDDLLNGEWPAILNVNSWFKLTTTLLAAMARAAGHFKDLPSRGNFPIDTKEDELTLDDNLPFPASQMELIKRLFEQLYARFDETGDNAALEERAKGVQADYWSRYEWLLNTCIGHKLIFLGEYINEEDFKTVIEQIVRIAPMEEITETICQGWIDECYHHHTKECA